MTDMNAISRKELLKKIQEADFLAYDLQLYLNTHPNCERSLKLYVNTIAESKELKSEFQRKYGPLTAGATPDSIPWQWSKNPWIWEKERS